MGESDGPQAAVVALPAGARLDRSRVFPFVLTCQRPGLLRIIEARALSDELAGIPR